MFLKKYIVIISLLSCIAPKAYAQHQVDDRNYPDSLTRVLKNAASDTARAGAFFLLSDYWSDKDHSKALKYAQNGLELSKNNSFYTGVAHFYIAGVYFEFDIPKSQQEYMLAEKILHPLNSKPAFQYRSRAWHNYAALEQRKDNSKGYTDIILNKAIPLALKAGDSIRVATNYMDVGLAFMNYEGFKKAIDYYKQAINLFHRSGKVYAELADCYTNTAKAYVLSGEHQLAKPYLDSAFKILSVNPESTFLPAFYLVQGMYYNSADKHDSALKSIEKGLKLAAKFNMDYDTEVLLYERYQALKGQKKLTEAKAILLNLYLHKKRLSLSHDNQQLLFELAHTDAALGNMKAAYQWMLLHHKLTDSIYLTNTNGAIAALDAKYNNAEKEKEILRLQNEKNTAAQQQQYNKLFYCSVIVMLGLGCFAAFIQLRNRKRMALKNEAQYHSELARIQQEKQLITYSAIMEGQEQERQRLARDLHDGLGGLLAGVKMNISKISDQAVGDNTIYQQLKTVSTQLDGSVDELRRIARNLTPETLFKFGLTAALKDFCEGLESEQTHIVFQAYGMDQQVINETSQILIYRIVQELVSNALKHARATNILVDCIYNNKQITITVEDNGIGFIPETVTGNGIGLANVQARVNYLNGKWAIQSDKGTGTTVTIEFTEDEKNATDIPANS